MKFYTHRSGSQQQTMMYNTVKYVQKTYKNRQDIAVSLRNLKMIDLMADRPLRRQAISTDAVALRLEQGGLYIVYQAKITPECQTLFISTALASRVHLDPVPTHYQPHGLMPPSPVPSSSVESLPLLAISSNPRSREARLLFKLGLTGLNFEEYAIPL